MRRLSWWLTACLVLTLGLGLGLPLRPAGAADYTLGAEDELSISVWLHPELERKLAVGNDGTISFPPIGMVKAAGLTTAQLGDQLADRLSTYLRQTTTVTVTVTRYLSRSVNVTGGVTAPGRYGFEEIPDIVTVINKAGGAVPGSDLTRVQIIRLEGEGKGTTNVDVMSAQRTGNLEGLPKLKPGDTLFLQTFAGGYAPAPGDGFAVLGEVVKPGIYQAGTSTSAWLALAQAGGVTGAGDLSKIHIISLTPDGQQVSTIDLKEALRHGGPVATVKPGDVMYVPHTTGSIAAKGWTAMTQALALTRDLVNIVIIADYLDKRNAAK